MQSQRITDLAAIAASADIGNARDIALATFADNGFPNLTVVANRQSAGSAPDGWLVVQSFRGKSWRVMMCRTQVVVVAFSRRNRLFHR